MIVRVIKEFTSKSKIHKVGDMLDIFKEDIKFVPSLMEEIVLQDTTEDITEEVVEEVVEEDITEEVVEEVVEEDITEEVVEDSKSKNKNKNKKGKK